VQDKFDARVHKALASKRELENELRAEELAAKENPALAAEWYLKTTVQMRRLYRRYLRSRFGIIVRRLDRAGYLLNRSRGPRTQHEGDLCLNAIAAHSSLEITWYAMNVAMRRAVVNGVNPASAACGAFFKATRVTAVLYGEVAQRGVDATAKESAIISLSGWVGSQISIKKHARIKDQLSDEIKERGKSVFEQFIQELPAASLVAWSEWQRDEPLRSGTGQRSFVSRTSELLAALGSKQGREARDRARMEEHESPTIRPRTHAREEQEESLRARRKPSPPPDVDIEDMELKLTMHQQRQQLDALIETALGGAPQQKAVVQRRRRGMEFVEIAAEMGIPENQVYVQYHNAIKKLGEARKAAGL
jgi:hypothetical protein